MELSMNLQTLTERAWALHDGLKDEIKNSISLCRFCSEHSRYCDVAVTTNEERERLIAVRDSLREVEDMLMYLQRLQSWQQIDMHAALTRLERSRLLLIEKVTQHQGRELDVVKDLNVCFGNEKAAFEWNFEKTMNKKADPAVHMDKEQISSFLICCSRILFNPWKWQKAVRIAVQLFVVPASIWSTYYVYYARQQYWSSQRKKFSFVDSAESGKIGSILTISKSPLDVFYGRG